MPATDAAHAPEHQVKPFLPATKPFQKGRLFPKKAFFRLDPRPEAAYYPALAR
jgi:hypothetical protein